MKTVFFDLGGVLIDFSHEKMCQQLAKLSGLTQDQMRAFLFDQKTAELYETGKIDSHYMHFKICQLAKRQLDYRDVMLASSTIFEPIPKTIALLDSLKMRGRKLILLSNTCEAHFDYAKKTYPFMRKFDAYLLSYKVGVRKPDPRIFQMALDLTISKPHDCLYIDDIETHTLAAAKLGLPSHHYTGEKALIDELTNKQFL